jgi:thiol-disulfide isomerase/thioredoxin
MKITYVKNNPKSEYYFEERKAIKQFINSINMKNKNIILKFSASWCGPCNYSTLELEKTLNDLKYSNNNASIKNQLVGKMETLILDIDIDKYENIASYFKIRSLPTVVTYFNGDVELVRNSLSYNEWISLFKELH